MPQSYFINPWYLHLLAKQHPRTTKAFIRFPHLLDSPIAPASNHSYTTVRDKLRNTEKAEFSLNEKNNSIYLPNNFISSNQPMSTDTALPNRLASLDILRGFDLFLLVFLQPVLVAFGQHVQQPWMHSLLYQLDHEVWVGFRFWDLIMPLFLFMTGVSMPFSLAKYKGQPNKQAVYRKVIKRFLLLFLFGMVIQGNLLGLDPKHIYFYTNTLQAIASGYLIAALLLLHGSVRTQLVGTFLLLLVYWLPMTFAGDFTPEGNFANRVDRALMGRFRGDPSYTWIWSSLTFGVTVMLGAFAGQILRSHRDQRKKAVQWLFLIGLLLTGLGWLWGWQMPIIKRIWSGSMVLLSGGYCFLLMGLFYYWIDYKGHTRGLNWLKIYGMNSITAYLLGETINFRCVAHSVCYGLEAYLGVYYAAWLTFANFLILFFILRWMYRQQLFLKI